MLGTINIRIRKKRRNKFKKRGALLPEVILADVVIGLFPGDTSVAGNAAMYLNQERALWTGQIGYEIISLISAKGKSRNYTLNLATISFNVSAT